MGQPNTVTESSLSDTRYYGDVNRGQNGQMRYEEYQDQDVGDQTVVMDDEEYVSYDEEDSVPNDPRL